jgi:hypothetical protein
MALMFAQEARQALLNRKAFIDYEDAINRLVLTAISHNEGQFIIGTWDFPTNLSPTFTMDAIVPLVLKDKDYKFEKTVTGYKVFII